MIKPIQQNVVFTGKNVTASDNFKGAIVPSRSVRQDYLNAVNNVNEVQASIKAKVNESLGNNLDKIA